MLFIDPFSICSFAMDSGILYQIEMITLTVHLYTVTPVEYTYTVPVTTTVRDLKIMIHQSNDSLKPQNMRLMLNRNILQNDKTLLDYQIPDHSDLYVAAQKAVPGEW